MKKKSIVAALVLALAVLLGSLLCTGADAASSPDEAIISGGSGEITPIPITEPSAAGAGASDFSSEDYALFYTQTTLPALMAGYFIIFKFKGTRTSEKMHRRKR